MGHAVQEITVVCFRVGEDAYALDIMRVKEILRPQPVTALPDAPAYVKGVINVRGTVIPLIDLRERFGLPGKSDSQTGRHIIVGVNGRSIGFVVDAVSEVATFAARDLRPPPPGVAIAGYRFLIGVCLLRDTMVLLLNPDRVLDSQALAVDAPIGTVSLSTHDVLGKE